MATATLAGVNDWKSFLATRLSLWISLRLIFSYSWWSMNTLERRLVNSRKPRLSAFFWFIYLRILKTIKSFGPSNVTIIMIPEIQLASDAVFSENVTKLFLLKMLWLLWRGRLYWQQGAIKFSDHSLLWFNPEQLKLGCHIVQAVLTYCRFVSIPARTSEIKSSSARKLCFGTKKIVVVTNLTTLGRVISDHSAE